jgi:DNA repair exonuclease SbcCD ATPase subunit
LAILIDDGEPGRKLDISAYSGGQKRRAECAIKRAMNELKRQSRGVTLGFHSYDEPTDGLDDKGKAAFIKMIMDDAAIVPVIILTNHDDTVKDSFDNRITFVRGKQKETVMA